jgi:Fungalysin metallopeptidase (M36)/Fungalysin/Thermolysin Propeptide Motif
VSYRSLDEWNTLQQVNFDLSPIVQGSPAFGVASVFQDLASHPAIILQQPIPTETKDLFIEGSFGEAVSDSPSEALMTVGQRIASEALGIAPGAENLKVIHSEVSLTGAHVVGAQTVEYLPVYGSELTVHLDNERRPYALTGRPFPDALGSRLSRPLRKHPDPASIVSDALKLPLDAVTIEEAAVPIDQNFVPSFVVDAQTYAPFACWRALVSFDGRLLAVYNIASSFYGEASAFLESPLRGSPARVRLDNLKDPTRLEGHYAAVKTRPDADISSQNGEFFYAETESSFDSPNLYFFLDQIRATFRSQFGNPQDGPTLLETQANFNPMVGYVHDPSAENNAYYSPETRQLYFGDIHLDSDERYTSRSRDIVIHEFTHAITDSICNLGRTMPHTQSRAMSEGYSDYFAASTLDNAVMGDYFMNDPAGFRSCQNNRRFPAGYAGEEHDVGEVWSGFLWSLRQDPDIGRGVTDVLALQSLYFLGPWRTIWQGMEAIALADRRLFPTDDVSATGRHEANIRAAFANRIP